MDRVRPPGPSPRTPSPRSAGKVGYRTLAVDGACYLYDTATNAIVHVPPAVLEIVDDYLGSGARAVRKRLAGRVPPKELDDALSFLQAGRANGMFEPMRRRRYLRFADAANLRAHYAEGLRVMTLALTERCNQRCEYCRFGGADRGAPRRPTMSWETARQSIEYLLSHAADGVAPTLDLYGGEPVLNWAVARQAILYVRQELHRRDVEIVFYTNASLLDRSKLELLVANDVTLQISLDGPARVHDRVRILPNGRGTHARVLRALTWIRRRDPVYYRQRVQPHCTFSLEDDLFEVFRYFSRPTFRDLRITFDYRIGDFPVSTTARLHHEAQLDQLTARYLAALRERRPFNRALFEAIMQSVLGSLKTRTAGPAPAMVAPNRACIPGHPMVFVSGDGAFHPCSIYNPVGSEIGHCSSGIDVDKAQELLRAYARFGEEMCQDCWAWRLCSLCFSDCVGDDGRPSLARKLDACRREKQRITDGLRRYVFIWQHEPASAARQKHTLRHAMRHQGR